jgi:hypothetical protein
VCTAHLPGAGEFELRVEPFVTSGRVAVDPCGVQRRRVIALS